MTINAFGDSITYGLGATVPYPMILSSFLDEPVNNYGVSGAFLSGGTQIMFTGPMNDSFLLTGVNDLIIYKTSNIVSFTENLESIVIARCCSNKIKAVNMGSSGGWSTCAEYGGALGQQTSTLGNWIYTVITGSVVYVVASKRPGAGTLKVTIDGVDYGPYNCNDTVNHPFVIRIDGLSNTSHNVVVENTSSNLIAVYFIGAAPCLSGPNFTVLGIIPMSAVTMATFSVTQSMLDAYTNAIASMAAFKLDGLNVNVGKLELNPMTQVPLGDVHPNNMGQASIAYSFMRSYKPDYANL